MKGKYISFLLGIVAGAALICGVSAADSIMAQLIPQTIYVDGQAVSVTSCMVGGSNYIKLRDIGKAVGFNVYWDGTVQVESGQPYTGEAPAKTTPVTQSGLDLNANMEARKEMIRLINQVRRENGVPELVVNEALMNTAQDCSAQEFAKHDNIYECQVGLAYGYPYGFSSNLTKFSGWISAQTIAQQAVKNWVNSPGHFQTMIGECYGDIGVGVTINGGMVTCFMFVGDEHSVNFYS